MDTRVKLVRGVNLTASEEATQLEKNLQRQLEEDVARIFDESIYTDLEVACGKSKLLTHSCILKARTNRFYRKLETFLHVNIGRNIFDEIYSFISDAYTECNITHQEKEILEYLNDNVILKHNCTKSQVIYNETYSTPRCRSPDKELNLNCLSPSTELTKEYYALVPIDGHLLEQELQPPLNKPTTLSLASSHTSDITKHSYSYNTLVSSNNGHTSHNEILKGKPIRYGDKTVEPIYTPDSLITDDPSSSSDYLSATYSWPQGISSSISLPHLIVNNKMDSNINNLVDSGLENSIVENQSNQHDVTLTDISLTESTAHDLTLDDLDQNLTSVTNPLEGLIFENSPGNFVKTSSSTSIESSNVPIDYQPQSMKVRSTMATNFLKDDKQRQSEKNVVLDSSSLSSETGSWVKSFLPKLGDQEVCEHFIENERQYSNEPDMYTNLWPSLNEGKPFKSTSCFIDAANLRDEEDNPRNLVAAGTELKCNSKRNNNQNSVKENLSDSVYPHKPLVTDLATDEAATKNCEIVKPPKTTSTWVIDVSTPLKTEYKNIPAIKKPLTSEVIFNSENHIRSGGSVDFDNSNKSSQKFFVDLTSLPDLLPQDCENASEKKIFSMYIDLGKKKSLKEMPTWLSTLNSKQQEVNTNKTEINTSKGDKLQNTSLRHKIDDRDSLATFEKFEELCNDPNISISKIAGIPKFTSTPYLCRTAPIKEIKHTILEFEEPFDSEATFVVDETSKPDKPFVKLSDLDKPAVKVDVTSQKPQKDHDELGIKTARSILEKNWGTKKFSKSCSAEIMTSFHSENEISLKRLFPHLKSEFSKSMPLSLTCKKESLLNTGKASNLNEDGNLTLIQTELDTSNKYQCGPDSDNNIAEMGMASCLIESCQSRLGQDLLRMFLEEIAPDVIVLVSGTRIKAHKCILSSRCQYFARILSGGWVESCGNVIVLPACSLNVAIFALCHIYSGVSVIPEWVCVVELAILANILSLDGLKEAIGFTLQSKYCHHFHKPCNLCITGVQECFIMCWAYGIDDLYYKCLKWITTHFRKIWPTKVFATLPMDLLERCYNEHCKSFTTETFIEWIYDVALTLDSLPNSKWAEDVTLFGRRLLNDAATFASDQLFEIFKKVLFMSADAPGPAKRAFEDCITSAIDRTTAEKACLAYKLLHYHVTTVASNVKNRMEVIDQNIFLVTHANNWLKQCEQVLIKSNYIATTSPFKNLPLSLQRRLRQLRTYGKCDEREGDSALSEREEYKQNKTQLSHNNNRNVNMDQVRAVFVPYAPKPTAKTGSEIRSTKDINELRKRIANPPFIRTTKAQVKRAQYNMKKRIESLDKGGSKPAQRRRPLPHQPKSGHPEPNVNINKEINTYRKKFENMAVSISSESSCNMSPPQMTNNRASRSKSKELRTRTISQDSLTTNSRSRTAEPSTATLTEAQASTSKHAACVKSGQSESQGAGPTGAADGGAQTAKTVTKTMIPMPQSQKYNAKKQSATYEVATKSLITTAQGERRLPGSLMNATKASQAKTVAKVVKESRGAIPKVAKHTGKLPVRRTPPPPALPRSGTFFKDEQPSCSTAKRSDHGRE